MTLAAFAAARGTHAPLGALEALVAAEPGLEATLGSIVELAQRAVPALAVHTARTPALTRVARADVPTWVARILLGVIPQPEPHPDLDAGELLGAQWPAERAKLRAMLAYFERIHVALRAHTRTAPPAGSAGTEVEERRGNSGDSRLSTKPGTLDESRLAVLLPGTFEIERVVVEALDADAWRASTAPLVPFEVAAGAIEDAPDCLQVDFANAFLGGGVLSGGNVQEEIRFAVAPEHLAAMIVSPPMRDDEAIVMRGGERFAATRGYASTLEYAGEFTDTFARLPDGTPDLELVAIDAIDYRRRNAVSQHTDSAILRELNKARAGFRSTHNTRRGGARPIATGNWGCGAFGGDPALKAVLQWLAASHELRAVRYFPFGDKRLGDLPAFIRNATARFGTVGPLFDRVLAVRGAEGATLFAQLLA